MLKLFEHNTLNVDEIDEASTAIDVRQFNLWFGGALPIQTSHILIKPSPLSRNPV